MDDRFDQVDAILERALDRPKEQRPAYLDEACGGDDELRASVERLLRACEEPDDRLVSGGGLDAIGADNLTEALRPEADLSSGAELGPYEIVELLGQGGMGRVFRARDNRLEREVALKVLDKRPGMASQLERFGREARAASALNHPNIVTIHDIGSNEAVSYIAMECIDGESLRDRLARGRLSIDETLKIAGHVASGLAAAHHKGIVHRDLKPANVMISTDGTAKIVDFGLAKIDPTMSGDGSADLANDPLTMEGLVFGTIGYMSPEQARGQRLDYRSDLFSFGALLYEMIAGKRAFARPSTAEVLAAILNEPPTPISAAAPGAPATLQVVVERCLQKDPGDRYESTRDLARDLRAARDLLARTASTQVRCDPCGTDNPPDHRFCSGCGAELTRSCPGCDERIAVDAAFCGSCGHAMTRTDDKSTDPTIGLADPGPPSSGSTTMASERRQATIVVTRLIDYDTIHEEALPEEVERMVTAFEGAARELIDRCGGAIDQTGPDEIVALFGIPVAHEDDALRAVRCALEFHELLRDREGAVSGAQFCSAVHTGLVVVHDSDATRGGRRAVGEAANLARALARRGEAGQVIVSPESRRLAGAAIRTAPLAPIQLGRGSEPLVPERVLGLDLSSMPPLEISDAPLTPFSGRQGELGNLMNCVESAVGGEGQFIAVVGEAGAGKSRLFYELRRQLNRERVTLFEGRCQPHSERAPYLPLIQACRDVLGVRDADSPEVQAHDAVERVLRIDPDLEVLLPLYLHLLSIPSEHYPIPEHLEGKPFRHAMQEALVALFTLASRERPLVLILEDWHWVDEASHDAVRQLAELCPEYPLLVAVSYRPEGSPDFASAAHQRTIQLPALGPLSSAAIMRSVLGAERIPEALIALVHERTGGNPFFLEEVCRTLREGGAVQVAAGDVQVAGPLAGLQLPESVQAVIRTRLDRIEPVARDLLRRTSVVGRDFSLSVLQRIADDVEDLDGVLDLLKERGLIRQARVLPEPVYRFQHALIQEVAYDSLLQRQRKDLHGRVGVALEQVHGEAREEYYDVLARHFAEAENWDKAVRYGQLSAQRARDLSQFADALTALESTRGWLKNLPESASTQEKWILLLQEEARVCEVVGDLDRQQATVDALLKLLGTQDRRELVTAYLTRAELMALAGEFEAGQRAMEKAVEVSRRLGDRGLERDTLRSLAFLHWQQEPNEQALAALDAALTIDREDGHTQRVVGDLTNRASVLRGLGRYDEALVSIKEARDLSQGPGHNPHRLIEALYVTYTLYRDLGRTDEGQKYLERAIAVQSRDRFTIHQPFHTSALANILLEQGDIDQALQLLRDSVEPSRRSRYAFGLSQCQQNLAHMLLGLGRKNEALPHLLEAAETFGRLRDHASEFRMLALAAPILEESGRTDEATAAWTRIAAANVGYRGRLDALRGLARIADAAGDSSDALEHLRLAVELCKEDDGDKGDLLNRIGILEWKRGRNEQALESYRQALAIFESLKDTVHAGLMLNSIGATLKPLGRLEQATETLERALVVHEQSGQELLRGHALALLGDLAHDQGEWQTAMTRYRESLELRRRIDDKRGEGWMRYQLARTLDAAGQRERAEENAAIAAGIAAKQQDDELARACDELGLL